MNSVLIDVQIKKKLWLSQLKVQKFVILQHGDYDDDLANVI